MRLILGSQSQGRQKVLRDAGIVFMAMPAHIDEKAIRSDDYQELPLLLARAKADKLMAQLGKQRALLLTADTVVTYRGELREKPDSPEQAREYLASYNEHDPAWVNTGIVVTDLLTGKQVEGSDRAAVYFKSIPKDVIEQAVADGYIFGCAGAFAAERPILQPYVARIEGEPTAIIGLPLKLAQRLLDAA